MSFNPIDLFFFLSLLLFSFTFIFSLLNPTLQSSSPPPRGAASGPRSHPIIGCLVSFYSNRRRLLEWYTELLAGSRTQTIIVSRLGALRTVVTANPANVEYILKTKFKNFPKGKPFVEILGDFLGHGIFNVDGELWAAQRKLASHEFTAKSLKEFVVQVLEEEVQSRLLPLLHSAAKHDQIIDLQEVLKRLTYDTICKVTLGTDPNCLDLSAPIPPLIHAFDTAAAISALRSAAPLPLLWKLKRLLNLGSERRLKHAIGTVHAVVDDVIRSKQNSLEASKGEDSGGNDLASRFLSGGYGGELVRDMAVSFIMAGRDTTSAAMTWLFYLLSTADAAAMAEIRAEVGPARPDYAALKRDAKYLHACLCETMRLYPPVAWDSKHAADDDVLPDGTPVRKGDRVTYFPYGMGRMETIWGKDRFEFRPDRWFDQTGCDEEGENNNSKKLKLVSPYEYPVFQAGPRVCLGKEMAFIQMKYVVASIITRFEFEPVSSDPPVFVPLLTAHMAGGFKVRVKEIKEAGGQ